ncbi:MAG: hypothetical protein JXR81_10980 [Candidatus Goldbacteria bacterium]|nr:hypothetical protein [Candidatus Goldiibacteriota bacterium]
MKKKGEIKRNTGAEHKKDIMFINAAIIIVSIMGAAGVFLGIKNSSPVQDVPAVSQGQPYAVDGRYKHLFRDVNSKEAILKIHIDEAKVLFESNMAVFVDSRSVNEYNQSHIKGAVSIPAGTPSDKISEKKSELNNKVLVTYCSGTGCRLADKAAHVLFDMGYKKIVIFFGGWPEWTQAGMPVEEYKIPEKYLPLYQEAPSAGEIKKINLEQAKFLYDNAAAHFVDVDTVENFSKMRIKGSHSVPLEMFGEMVPKFKVYMLQKPVVVFSHKGEEKAAEAAKLLYKDGIKRVLIFPDGIMYWDRADYPMVKASKTIKLQALQSNN